MDVLALNTTEAGHLRDIVRNEYNASRQHLDNRIRNFKQLRGANGAPVWGMEEADLARIEEDIREQETRTRSLLRILQDLRTIAELHEHPSFTPNQTV